MYVLDVICSLTVTLYVWSMWLCCFTLLQPVHMFLVLLHGCSGFYRAMHFSAKRGIAIACCLALCPSVTLVNCDHIGWNSSKIIPPLVSMGRSLFATLT